MDRVARIARCRLTISPEAWAWAGARGSEIDAHWARRSVENPAMFNGVIHVMHDWRIVDDGAESTFHGRLHRTDFKSYLYWREQGFPEAGVKDAFGSALLRSADGHVLLGRQRAGNVNAGRAYLPGGFIDPRDARGDVVDIEASIAREVAEETGLGGPLIEPVPGLIVTFCGPLVSIAKEYRIAASAEEARAHIRAHIASDPAAELADAVIVRSRADLADATVHDYARQLLGWLLDGG